MHVSLWSFACVSYTPCEVSGWPSLPDEESLHQRSTSESDEKLLRVRPSVLTSRKSWRVEQLRFVLLLFLMIFKVEKKRSTLAVKKGKVKSSSLTNKMFGHFTTSGEEYNWHQTLFQLSHPISPTIVNNFFNLIRIWSEVSIFSFKRNTKDINDTYESCFDFTRTITIIRWSYLLVLPALGREGLISSNLHLTTQDRLTSVHQEISSQLELDVYSFLKWCSTKGL